MPRAWDYSALIGRRIVAVDPRPFPTGFAQGGETSNPRITLDDGSRMVCLVVETERQYGVEIIIEHPRPAQAAPEGGKG